MFGKGRILNLRSARAARNPIVLVNRRLLGLLLYHGIGRLGDDAELTTASWCERVLSMEGGGKAYLEKWLLWEGNQRPYRGDNTEERKGEFGLGGWEGANLNIWVSYPRGCGKEGWCTKVQTLGLCFCQSSRRHGYGKGQRSGNQTWGLALGGEVKTL